MAISGMSTVAEWLVALKGHEFDLEDLPLRFSGADCAIVREDEGYCLKSSSFESITAAGDVLTYASQLIDLMNSIRLLEDSGFQLIELERVVRVDDDGARHQYVYVSGSVKARSKVRAVGIVLRNGVKIIEPHGPSRPERLLDLAKRDHRVAEALCYFRSPTSRWFQLYKVLDAIELDLGGEQALRSKHWASSKQLTRFTRTANNAGVLGPEARHSEGRFDPPPKPMTLEEAEQLIQTVCNEWIDWKLAGCP